MAWNFVFLPVEGRVGDFESMLIIFTLALNTFRDKGSHNVIRKLSCKVQTTMEG